MKNDFFFLFSSLTLVLDTDTFCINASNLIEIYYGKFAFVKRNTLNLCWNNVLKSCCVCVVLVGMLFFSFKYFVQIRKIAFERCCLWPKFSFSIFFFCFLYFFCSSSISIECALTSHTHRCIVVFLIKFYILFSSATCLWYQLLLYSNCSSSSLSMYFSSR